jgi:hypothetical protein
MGAGFLKEAKRAVSEGLGAGLQYGYSARFEVRSFELLLSWDGYHAGLAGTAERRGWPNFYGTAD